MGKIIFDELQPFIERYFDLKIAIGSKQFELDGLETTINNKTSIKEFKLLGQMQKECQDTINDLYNELEKLKMELKPLVPLIRENRLFALQSINKIQPQLLELKKLEEENKVIINALRSKQKGLSERSAEYVAMCTNSKYKENSKKLNIKKSFDLMLREKHGLEDVEEFTAGRLLPDEELNKLGFNKSIKK